MKIRWIPTKVNCAIPASEYESTIKPLKCNCIGCCFLYATVSLCRALYSALLFQAATNSSGFRGGLQSGRATRSAAKVMELRKSRVVCRACIQNQDQRDTVSLRTLVQVYLAPCTVGSRVRIDAALLGWELPSLVPVSGGAELNATGPEFTKGVVMTPG